MGCFLQTFLSGILASNSYLPYNLLLCNIKIISCTDTVFADCMWFVFLQQSFVFTAISTSSDNGILHVRLFSKPENYTFLPCMLSWSLFKLPLHGTNFACLRDCLHITLTCFEFEKRYKLYKVGRACSIHCRGGK